MREDIINEKLAALGGVVEVPQFSHVRHIHTRVGEAVLFFLSRR
jgi:hypothetical protein